MNGILFVLAVTLVVWVMMRKEMTKKTNDGLLFAGLVALFALFALI